MDLLLDQKLNGVKREKNVITCFFNLEFQKQSNNVIKMLKNKEETLVHTGNQNLKEIEQLFAR